MAKKKFRFNPKKAKKKTRNDTKLLNLNKIVTSPDHIKPLNSDANDEEVDKFREFRSGPDKPITKLTTELGEKIKELYTDPNYEGSFCGSVVFTRVLAAQEHIFLPYRKILRLLHSIADYVESSKKRFVFPRRSYDVHGFGVIFQTDVGFLRKAGSSSCFVVLVDVFSYHLYAEKLPDKSGPTVLAAVKRIIDSINKKLPPAVPHVPQELESDRGSEYTSRAFKEYMAKSKIYWRAKYGNLKACFAEYNCHRIKQMLGMIMREKLTTRWDLYFDAVIDHLNNTPNQHNHFVKPGLINSPLDNFIIDQEKGTAPKSPDYLQQLKNQRDYMALSGSLKPGAFVLLDYPKKAFSKSSEMQRSPEVLVVDSVDAMLRPPMYRLRNLQNKPISGHYYKYQARI